MSIDMVFEILPILPSDKGLFDSGVDSSVSTWSLEARFSS